MSIPVIRMDKRQADEAWEVHRALVKAEADNPALAHNPQWICFRMDAYEAFCRAFEGEG